MPSVSVLSADPREVEKGESVGGFSVESALKSVEIFSLTFDFGSLFCFHLCLFFF